MADAVAERLEQLMQRAGLGEDDGDWKLLAQMRDGVEPRLVKTGKLGLTLVHYACRHGWLEFVKSLIQEYNCDPHAKTQDGVTPLHYACRYGWIDIVRYLTSEQHCDPDCIDNNQRTPLHWLSGWDRKCTQEEAVKIVRYLISLGKCDVNKRDKDDNTALILACRREATAVARCLINEGHCDVTIRGYLGDTALHKACRCNETDHSEISKLLLEEARIDPNTKNNDGHTPLHLACKWGRNSTLVQLIVKDERSNPNEKDSKGDTALHVLCRLSRDDGISKLLLEEAKIDPNAKNNDGDTPLHLACKWGKNSTLVQLLVRDERCNLNEKNSKGDTALHVACCHSRDDISKFLLEEAKIDPNTKNNDGNTPLHLACSARNSTLAQLLLRDERCNPNEKNSKGDTALHVACRLSRDDKISKLLLEEAKIDPNAKNSDGDTALHLACMGWGDSTLVQLLVRDERCNPHEKNSKGDTALHVACRIIRGDTVFSNVLLEETKIDPNAKNNDGDTPLHLACSARNSILVQLLLRDERCNALEKNSKGDTALDVACRLSQATAVTREPSKLLFMKTIIDDGLTPLDLTSDPDVIRELIRHGANPQDVYKTHGKVLGKYSSKQPLETPVKLFMVGNPSAGKSTLTKALQSEMTGFKRLVTHSKPVLGVDEKTAGIVPHEFESKIYGRVTLYDFAGQREFYGSHAALLQNAIQTSTPIFLLVVDLSKIDDDIKGIIFYWLSFLENQCTSVSSKPHLVAVGSHADMLKSRGEDPKHKASFIISLLTTPQFPSLRFTGFVAMDCQYANSAGMTELHRILKTSCDSLRTQENINFNAHCFLVYLLDKFRGATALTLAAIQARIKEDLGQRETSAEDIKYFVPSNIHSLEEICKQLNDRGHLLVLKNPTAIENSWVIINQTALLAEVNGTIFAPEGFKEHIRLASSTGVVLLSSITKHFPTRDLTMLVGFLSHLEFCHEISDLEILELIRQEQMSTASQATSVQDERYFFFPGLVTLEVPSTVWEPQPQFDYHCGWMLQFCVLGQFFFPRFVQVLLLRLAFSFAFAQEKWCIEEGIPTLQRKCSVWKNGICWGDAHGIETLVEIAEQNRVVVLMRCPEVKFECLQLRSLLIQKVLAAAREFCSKVNTVELFINPSDTIQYPLKPTSQLKLFSIENIASVISQGMQSASALDKTGKPVSLDTLLSFEPYTNLGEPILRELFAANNTKQADILSISELIPEKNTELMKKIFKPNPTQLRERLSAGSRSIACPAYHVLDIWRASCEGTYQCLREKLDQFSVFVGRNPLEIARVSCESRPQPPSTDGSPEIAPAMEHMVSVADVDMLAEVLSDVAAHWDLFLGQIGLPSHVQDEVRNENSKMAKFSKRCLLEGLRRWVKSEGTPTYGRITAALRGDTVYNIALAQRVEGFAESRHSSEPC